MVEREEYNHINTAIGVSPVKFNVAFTSINSRGTLGELNMYVLKELGYDNSEIEKIDVSKGYFLLKNKRNKPILFIVTVRSNEFSGITLQRNLSEALVINEKFLKSKKVWVPLMATGVGKMSFVDSYDTTKGLLKNYPQINFTIAVPDDKRGNDFFNRFIENDIEINDTENDNDTFISFVEENAMGSKSQPIENVESNKLDISKLKSGLGSVKYFVAGHIWNGEDQMPRFIGEKIWENGHDNNDINAVNTATKNDIIFIKSTYASKEGISYLRIKAIGVVINNENDGHNLDVNWHVFENHIDIEGLGKYRRTFAGISEKDISNILGEVLKESPYLSDIVLGLSANENFSENLKSSISQQPKDDVKSITTIAGLLSDADSGADYLDISKDVNAFAKVMSAKSFSPPLAIALLGKWGSGKSFFMRKLKERIQTLSKSENHGVYCNGVAHVHFNAWSYMDSNLWAGIITKIFEGLQEYITNDTLASLNKKEIEKALTKKLNIAHEEIIDLEHQKENIDNKIKILEFQKDYAELTLKNKIDEIKNRSIKTVLDNLDETFEISEKVSSALANNNSFNRSTEKFGEIIPKEYWKDPTELYKKVKSKYTYVKTFFKGANWKMSLTWFCIILIFVISMKTIVFFLVSFFDKTDFTFPTKAWYFITLGGTFIYRNYKTFKHLQPLISTFWKIKEDYELQKKDAIFKVNQEEKALKFEIENFKTEIQTINEQINQAKQSKLEIEYRLENTLTTEALFNFIEKRSLSEDYKKHLGIVSVIRKDFEILSELFSGHQDELNNSEESEKFQEQFDKPLERIILYIDDLDRCSDDRVVQVLEAVNLLMAYPLFVVVVGVDPRWVKNALTKKYKLQFTNESDLNGSESIEPSAYLEKIFQVPFKLKSASNESVKHMLKTLAESQPKIQVEKENFLFEEEGELADHFDDIVEELSEDGKPQVQIVQKVIKKEIIESLKFSNKEIELLQSMSDILGTNPRALKRFVNIYRVIKAHEDFNYINEAEEGELLAVMFLIAFPLGKYRKLVKPFEKYINDDINDGNLAGFETSKTEQYIIEKTMSPGSDKFPLESLRMELLRVLQINLNDTLLDQKKELFRKHNPFIKRFTFNNL
jgi:hypothetical protein